MKVELLFHEEILGMSPADPKIATAFTASKAPDALSMEEEVAALGVEGVLDKIKTIFPKLEDGTPFCWNYQIKGMLKDFCGSCSRMEGTISSNLKAYKKIIDGLVFIYPRKVAFNSSAPKGVLGECERAIRIVGAQGERTALLISETMPAGTKLTFDIEINELKNKVKAKVGDKEKLFGLTDLVKEWLDYGSKRGWGQWRNSGKGIFTWKIVE